MSGLHLLGIGSLGLPRFGGSGMEYVLTQRPLKRVLEFTGCSIHDVINDPIRRNMVHGYYRLHKQVERACEVVDMERWWNGKSMAFWG